MSDSAERRGGPSPFGASLLDLMTCGFGAVLLLFILKGAHSSDAQQQVAGRLKAQQAINQELTIEQQRLEVATNDAIKRRSSRQQGPRIFGLPALTGRVLILVDSSPSIAKSEHLSSEAALLTATLIASNPGVGKVMALPFARRPAAADAKWHDVSEVQSEDFWRPLFTRDDLGNCTNLVDALSIGLIRAHETAATVILVSDGVHNCNASGMEVLDASGIVERLETALGKAGATERPVALHTIGIFRAREYATAVADGSGLRFGESFLCADRYLSSDESTRLAELLRALALRWQGAFIGLPVEDSKCEKPQPGG